MTQAQTAPLYGERLAPVTSSIGFVRAPMHEAAEALCEWRQSIHGSAQIVRLQGGLVDNISRLEPLTGGVRPRELVVGTASPEWTAVFDCGVQGGDQITTVGYLARTKRWHGVVVTYIPDSADASPERFGARQLELFGPVATDFLNYVRTISVVREGSRWRFDATGTVQDFEDEKAYRKRRVADRFTPEMLRDYATALGLSPFDESFYPGPSALVVNPATPPPGGLVLDLASAQRRVGIVPAG